MSLVYSTGVGRIKPEAEVELPPETDGWVRLYKETKGRKGAGVVRVADTGLDKEELKKLSKTLKSKLGVGGSVEEWDVIVQGADKRDKVKEILEKLGYKVKLVGG